MNKVLKRLCVMGIIVLVAASSSAVEPAGESRAAATTDSTPMIDQLRALRLELEALSLARETALTEVRARYNTALPEERTAIEQEGAEVTADFDRARLELVAEYHRLSGNELELARAEAQLEVIDAGVQTGTPRELDRTRTIQDATPVENKEGVVNDD